MIYFSCMNIQVNNCLLPYSCYSIPRQEAAIRIQRFYRKYKKRINDGYRIQFSEYGKMRCFVLLVWSNILKFTFLNLTSLLCSSIFLFLLWMNQFPCIYLNNKTVLYFPLLPFPSLFLSFPFFTFLFSIQCYSFPLPCCALIYYLPLFFLISSFSNLRPSTPLFSSHPLLLFLLYLLLFSFSSSFTVSVTSSSSSSSSFFLVQARVWRRRKALNCIFEFLSACSKCTAQGVRTYVHVYVRKNWLISIFIFPSSIFITRYSFLFLVFSRVLIFLIIFHFILFYFYVENSDFCLFSNVILTFFSFHFISFLFFSFLFFPSFPLCMYGVMFRALSSYSAQCVRSSSANLLEK